MISEDVRRQANFAEPAKGLKSLVMVTMQVRWSCGCEEVLPFAFEDCFEGDFLGWGVVVIRGVLTKRMKFIVVMGLMLPQQVESRLSFWRKIW